MTLEKSSEDTNSFSPEARSTGDLLAQEVSSQLWTSSIKQTDMQPIMATAGTTKKNEDAFYSWLSNNQDESRKLMRDLYRDPFRNEFRNLPGTLDRPRLWNEDHLDKAMPPRNWGLPDRHGEDPREKSAPKQQKDNDERQERDEQRQRDEQRHEQRQKDEEERRQRKT